MKSEGIKVAVNYRGLQHWRVPAFQRLNASGEFEVCVFHGRAIPGTKIVTAENVAGFTSKQMPTWHVWIRSSGRASPLIICPTLIRELYRFRPDVILSEGGSNIANNLQAMIYATIMRVPYVWWTLGELPGRKFSGLGRFYRWLVRVLESKSTALLGYSSVAMSYFERMGYPLEKCFRAVNCVDTAAIMALPPMDEGKTRAIRSRLGVKDGKTILFVGALTAEKRIDRLLRAFSVVASAVDESRLVIIGGGPYEASARELASELGLGEKAAFLGDVRVGVDQYFRLGSVFVLPGLGGLAISEAMCHGLPVICVQGDGCEVDLVRDGETGFRIRGSDDASIILEMAGHLIRLLSCPEEAHRMGLAARRVIENEVNIETYVEGISRALRYALAQGGRR